VKRTCTSCGCGVFTEHDRCHACRKNDGTDIPLRGGRWVTRGLIKRYETSSETPGGAGEEAGAATPEAQGERVEHVSSPRSPAAGRAIRFPGRPVCPCGCLLARDGEDCPACRDMRNRLGWGERAAIEASWRPIYYQPAPEFIQSNNKTDVAPYMHGEITVAEITDRAREGSRTHAATTPKDSDLASELSGDRKTIEVHEATKEVA